MDPFVGMIMWLVSTGTCQMAPDAIVRGVKVQTAVCPLVTVTDAPPANFKPLPWRAPGPRENIEE